MDRESVIVVGAGPVGLTLAAELARHGVRPRVVDAAHARTVHSKALALHARSLELLERMGCVDGFLEIGLRSPGMVVRSHGRRLGQVSFEGLPSRFQGILLVPQSETERLLEAHCASLGVQVERDTRLVSVGQDEDEVRCVLRHADGTEETARASYLVGCDGAHSAVRHALGMESVGRSVEGMWLLADVDLDWPLPAEEACILLDESGLMVYLPIRPGRARLVFLTDGEDRDTPIAPDETARRLAELGPRGARIRERIWESRLAVSERMVADYRVGRCFVAGGAAHTHNPTGAQGLNTGIQDAANLAWKLAAVARELAAPEPLLSSYSPERAPVAARALRASDRMLGSSLATGRARRLARDAALGTLLHVPPAVRRLRLGLSELAVSYVDGPISQDVGRRRGLHAGDRVPDVALRGDGGRIRLQQRLRSSVPTLLLLAGDSRAPQQRGLFALTDAALAALGDEVEGIVISQAPLAQPPDSRARALTDVEGTLHRAVRSLGPTALVIRPDGYVSLRLDPPSLSGILDHMSERLGWRVARARAFARVGIAVPASSGAGL